MRVLLPGKRIDAILVRLASKASWEPLLQAGIDSHEYLPTMLHTKLLIIDGSLVSVGSTNFDIRSFRLNDEASVNVYDRALAAQMTEAFERDLQQAERYTLERRRAPAAAAESGREAGASVSVAGLKRSADQRAMWVRPAGATDATSTTVRPRAPANTAPVPRRFPGSAGWPANRSPPHCY